MAPRLPNPESTADRLRSFSAHPPGLGIVLGTGFQPMLREVDIERRVRYGTLPGFPCPGVEGHAGELVLGRLAGTPVVILNGRAHYYEGHSMERVTFAVRTLAAFGVRDLLLTNAAGGMNRKFRPGDFMTFSDHINLMGVNPLRGEAPESDFAPGRLDKRARFHPWNCRTRLRGLSGRQRSGADDDAARPARFVDLTDTYDAGLRALLRRAARECGVTLRSGVYLAVSGPSYETPAEIRAFRRLGADAVGMSTVPEAIVARQCGLKVAAVSCITNAAAGMGVGKLSHQEVLQSASRAAGLAAQMLKSFGKWYGKMRQTDARHVKT